MSVIYLCGDTLCGQNAIYINSVRTSQETHYVSATKPNRLMLFRETVAVYCEKHTEHTDTLSTETKRLMLFRETVAVYCENHTEHINTLCGQRERERERSGKVVKDTTFN
jgi:hypothetical protein